MISRNLYNKVDPAITGSSASSFPLCFKGFSYFVLVDFPSMMVAKSAFPAASSNLKL